MRHRDELPPSLAAGRWVVISVMGYVVLGLAIALLTPVLATPQYLAQLWDREVQALHWASWPLRHQPGEQPRVVRWSEDLTTVVYRDLLPTPQAGQSQISEQIGSVTRSSLGWDPGNWYRDRGHPNGRYYLPLVVSRALVLAWTFVAGLAVLIPSWFLGQARARIWLREAMMPRTHRFRWYRFTLYGIICGACTWVFVPLSLVSILIAPASCLLAGVLIYRVRLHGIEM